MRRVQLGSARLSRSLAFGRPHMPRSGVTSLHLQASTYGPAAVAGAARRLGRHPGMTSPPPVIVRRIGYCGLTRGEIARGRRPRPAIWSEGHVNGHCIIRARILACQICGLGPSAQTMGWRTARTSTARGVRHQLLHDRGHFHGEAYWCGRGRLHSRVGDHTTRRRRFDRHVGRERQSGELHAARHRRRRGALGHLRAGSVRRHCLCRREVPDRHRRHQHDVLHEDLCHGLQRHDGRHGQLRTGAQQRGLGRPPEW